MLWLVGTLCPHRPLAVPFPHALSARPPPSAPAPPPARTSSMASGASCCTIRSASDALNRDCRSEYYGRRGRRSRGCWDAPGRLCSARSRLRQCNDDQPHKHTHMYMHKLPKAPSARRPLRGTRCAAVSHRKVTIKVVQRQHPQRTAPAHAHTCLHYALCNDANAPSRRPLPRCPAGPAAAAAPCCLHASFVLCPTATTGRSSVRLSSPSRPLEG